MSTKVPLPGLTSSQQDASNTSQPSVPTHSFNPSKNPFLGFNTWTPDSLKQITINVNEPIESTNNLTRESPVAARHWNADINFKFSNFESRILKQSAIEVPAITAKNYGVQYMYVAMPMFLGEAIVKAAESVGIRTSLKERTLGPANGIWWKTLNGIENYFGVVDEGGNFTGLNLAEIIKATELGAVVNLDFTVKLHLTKNKPATELTVPDRVVTDEFVIKLTCSRAAVKKLKHYVEPPPSNSRVPQQAAARSDVAPDELMQLLKGLNMQPQ